MSRSVPLEQLTLRDKIRESARRSKELIEHLDQGFIPRVHSLKKLVRIPQPDEEAPPVGDASIRNQVAEILESERYTTGIDEDNVQLCEAIVREIEQMKSKGRR